MKGALEDIVQLHQQKKKAERLKTECRKMRIKSGKINSHSKLICFLYLLMRDMITPGKVENLILDMDKAESYQFTNGWLAKYAENIAKRLK